MISADAGGRPNVNGSSIATVVSGEMPGSTPTSVPIMTPAKQNSRFCQLAAVASPNARLSNSSTAAPHQGQRSGQDGAQNDGQTLNGKPRPFTNSSVENAASNGPNRMSRPHRTGPVAVPATSTQPMQAAIRPRVENSTANRAIEARIANSGRHASSGSGSGAP